jgi:hypothetical protein
MRLMESVEVLDAVVSEVELSDKTESDCCAQAGGHSWVLLLTSYIISQVRTEDGLDQVDNLLMVGDQKRRQVP